jgi:molybdate transport system permease protein
VTRPDRRASTRPPIVIVVLAISATAFFAAPLVALLWRAPWSRSWDYLTERTSLTALQLSIVCSVLATVLSIVFGVPLAWLLARVNFHGRSAVRALCTLSMVLPPVVAGVGLLLAFGRRGLVGRSLDEWFGVRLPFTIAAVVLAQTFVAMPFLVFTVEGALRQLDPAHEHAARTLGGSSWYTFRRVTLPSIRSALLAGSVLAWARALGEFGATITFAGNSPGSTQTMPLAVYLALDTNPEKAIVLALVLIVISFTVIVALRDQWLGGLRSDPGASQ